MLMNAPATFIQSYIDDLNDALNQLKPGAALTRIQAAWLGTCLTCILLMNSVCWAKFERASSGAPCYLTKFRDSCRRNSFTYAANRRCSSRPASATD
ncbi:hypothetical protein [Bathymodiolus japonicus methanotrophic gill symbiont]|uniref:hypothetical protein n=1 Tax=Bathymodiolus japonicus methanotrophic gill symbiont TaxID=113269 RepID=UPI001C8E7B44|nr:hypothetical protein [Bathymodiolus japonicus methanotrophic gill symbiont]